ncbi:hypothetical protein ACQKPE_08335 [Pseudomonas sp. NPDC089554]|uniref:hypothetical protein n=1 Tax=Pseudomonas sp. NPDC089554 TaxID=3390653 RepID=UPI003D093B73
MKEHMPAIERASAKRNFAITFRAAGSATLHALKKGAAAKGHDILEKTIKWDSISDKYTKERAEAVFASVREAGIEGYVGHWDDTGLVGIYRTGQAGKGHEIYPIDVDQLASSLEALKQQDEEDEDEENEDKWSRWVFTGDYDAHDMIDCRGSGRPRTVTARSKEERSIIDAINQEIALVDANRPFKLQQYNVVRHGAQVNFAAYMRNYEKNKVLQGGGIAAKVARPGSFPLAAVRKNTWTIIHSISELAQYYKSLGAVMKDSWTEGGDFFFEDQPDKPGIVKLSRKRPGDEQAD